MPATAIDIGSYAIKALVGQPGKQPVINKAAFMLNSTGLAFPEDDSQAEKIMAVLDKFIHDYKLPIEDIRLSLPEEVVATKIINLPPLSDAELASAIDWQAEQYLPIPLEEMTLEYRVLFRPTKKDKNQPMRVFLVASRKTIVERYTGMFLSLGIQPKVMETQILSIIRSLGFEPNDPATMLVHFGANNTQLAIVNQGELKLAVNQKGGGSLLTKAISQTIDNLPIEQAEQYKCEAGIKPEPYEGKIRQILLPAIESLVSEIVKTLRYYNNQNTDQAVKQIVVSGGGSQLPGLMEYLTQATDCQILAASPLAVAKGDIPTDNQSSFIVDVGLLMRRS